MIRRLDTLNALTDSNRLLHEEKSSLIIQLEKMTTKAASLEAEVDSLRCAQRESSLRIEELTTKNPELRSQAASDGKRLQLEKEELQMHLDAEKEANSRINIMLTKTQETNAQLMAAQHRLNEEIRMAREEGIKWATEKRNQVSHFIRIFFVFAVIPLSNLNNFIRINRRNQLKRRP